MLDNFTLGTECNIKLGLVRNIFWANDWKTCCDLSSKTHNVGAINLDTPV